MPVHVAITRRVLPGKEEEFKRSLQRFLGESFINGGIHGASMITGLPGSDERDIGILRTFADETERDAFYNSALYKDWEAYASTVTEGEPVHRELHGLEAWFREPGGSPARWKMAIATFIGVYPTSLILTYTLGPLMDTLSTPLGAMVMAVFMVLMLTWLVMPVVTRSMKKWLVT